MEYADIHADDYALSLTNSRRILTLLQEGALDSFSIIPNMRAYDEAMKLLEEAWPSLPKKPLISVHLNIADGQSLAGLTDPILTHPAGELRVFHTSYAKLLLLSYVPGVRTRLRREIASELTLQIRRVYGNISAYETDPQPLRLDSHTHLHMVPVVFDAMLDAVKTTGLSDRLAFVRVSGEPIAPFRPVARTIKPVNLIKNVLLNLLALRANRKLGTLASRGTFWGLMMSGKMDAKRVHLVLPAMLAYAKSKGITIEILFHPGIVPEAEADSELLTPGDRASVTSKNRDLEYEAVISLHR